jgi:hypothetical protein
MASLDKADMAGTMAAPDKAGRADTADRGHTQDREGMEDRAETALLVRRRSYRHDDIALPDPTLDNS